jgi:hypothetical protein
MEARLVVRNVLRIIIACAVAGILIVPAKAQYKVASSLFKPPPVSQDFLVPILSDSVRSDSAKEQKAASSSRSPTTAILLSAVLPGVGQIYNGRYWKAPIVWGFSAYFVSQALKMNDHYTAARSSYQQSVDGGENNGQGNAQYLYERDFYRDARDRFAFYLLITYFLNIIDAYVDASLFNFDVGDNLGGGTSVKISIPLH